MLTAATLWNLACQALAGEQFGQAVALLEARGAGVDEAERGWAALYLASVFMLYGNAELRNAAAALAEAEQLAPQVVGSPLHTALQAELEARRGGAAPAPEVVAAVQAGGSALARFHLAAALVVVGDYAQAQATAPQPSDLPPHLGWRMQALLGDMAENLGDIGTALTFLQAAAAGAVGLERAVVLQECAALLLAQGELTAAGEVLGQAKPLYPQHASAAATPADEALYLATWHYLKAQTELLAERPERALPEIEMAAALEARSGERSYGVALVRGQVLSRLARLPEAVQAFAEAIALAQEAAGQGTSAQEAPAQGTSAQGPAVQGADVSFARHELGVALLDLDQPLDAAEQLRAVHADAAYPFQAEVLADLAEAYVRMGDLSEGRARAEEALAEGAVVPASLVLGNIAMEYYDLSEALTHFQRAADAAAPATQEWLTAHQMAADILAQQGFPDPASAYAHAQQALEHTPGGDDWRGPLEGHLARAEALLHAGEGRVLN